MASRICPLLLVLTATALGGCEPVETASSQTTSDAAMATGEDVSVAPKDTASAGEPSVELALTIQNAFATGALVATVEGARPGAAVVLYGSTDAEAEASCPEVLAPACLAFGGEEVVVEGVADGEGVAILHHEPLVLDEGGSSSSRPGPGPVGEAT